MAVPTTRTIGGSVFTVSPLLYDETCDLQPLIMPLLPDFLRLFMLFAGGIKSLGAGAEEMEAGEALGSLEPMLARASDVIAQIATKLPPDKFRQIRRGLLRGATMDGKPLYATVEGGVDLIGSLMKGRTIDGWKLLLFAIEVNYPDFFEIVGAMRKDAANGKASPFVSTMTTPDAGQVAASS